MSEIKDMAQPAWLYKEDWPQGKVFDLDKVSITVLAEQGWVDNPAKLGIDAWGGDHEKFAETRRQVLAGEIPRIGRLEIEPADEERELLERTNNDLYAQLKREREERQSVERKMKEQAEELADMRSDAAKLKAKPRKATRRSGKAEDAPVRGRKAKPEAKAEEEAEAEAEAEAETEIEL